jgi:hypothetical protein
MKSRKKKMSFPGLSNVTNNNRNWRSSMKSSNRTLSLVLLSILAVSSAVPCMAKPKKTANPSAANGQTVELPWASASDYPGIQIQSVCQASDSKHATWQIQISNRQDSSVQIKGIGKTVNIDAGSTMEFDPLAVKDCGKALLLKFDARIPGEPGHFALEYKNGTVSARYKAPKDWMGMTSAIMTGVAVGMASAQ